MKTKQLAEMIKDLRRKKLEEARNEKMTTHKGSLGALEVRDATSKKKSNQNRNPNDYKMSGSKKTTLINTEPEINSTLTGY